VIEGRVVTILGMRDSDNPGIGLPVDNSSNITLTGGAATATNQGTAEADASALIIASQDASINIGGTSPAGVGGNITINGGDADATGSKATALAIAGTEIGQQITGLELFNVKARNIFITSGSGNSIDLGQADGFASLASSGAINITVTGQGSGQGLVLDGAGGSGLFDALGSALVRVPGTGYPITVTGRIELLSPAAVDPRQDALVVAGAPLIDESLLAAFLRATEAAREETFAQDPNLQQRNSKGQAGVCR
jgi:hypothetical protein